MKCRIPYDLPPPGSLCSNRFRQRFGNPIFGGFVVYFIDKGGERPKECWRARRGAGIVAGCRLQEPKSQLRVSEFPAGMGEGVC